MEVREDFKPVEDKIKELIKIGEELKQLDQTEWPQLKNMGDFEKIYYMTINEDVKRSFERLYEDGRLIASQLWHTILSVNITENYPDLYSFVKYLETGWINEENINFLSMELKRYQNDYDWLLQNYGYGIRSVKEMLQLYERQLDLIKKIKQIIDELKSDPMYTEGKKEESGFFSFFKKLWKK
ncbi:hypothetical protein [Persephonella sp.]